MPKPKRRKYPVMTLDQALALLGGSGLEEPVARSALGIGVGETFEEGRSLPPGVSLRTSWRGGGVHHVSLDYVPERTRGDLERWLEKHRPKSHAVWLQAQTIIAIRRGLRDHDDD